MIYNAILGHIVGDVTGLPYEMCPRSYLKDMPFKGIDKKKKIRKH